MTLSFTEWEDGVISAIEGLELTRSDAQGVLDGQSFVCAQSWTRGLTPEAAAQAVWTAATAHLEVEKKPETDESDPGL